MHISVFSETAPLQTVLLHRPGPELEQLTPARLESMLFDDIPFITGAQREHDAFARELTDRGIEVKYLKTLTAEALGVDDAIRRQFIDDFITQSGGPARYYRKEMTRFLMDIEDTETMVEKTMAGVMEKELEHTALLPLAHLARSDNQFIVDPMPNLYFTRDPMATIGRGASISRMHASIRRREAIFARYILEHHPTYRGTVPFYYTPELPFSIEGGDILNVGRGMLMVGLSQRTAPEAVELLAKKILHDEESGIDRVLALDIPKRRAFMHLDTVLTQVDSDAFTVHPYILQNFRAFLITKKDKSDITVKEIHGTLDAILAEQMQQDAIRMIRCGGDDDIAAQREQWNDASNTLCIAPGVVVVYDRNAITNRIIRDHGIQTVEIPGSELGRGRGGPRCMSMPLQRRS